jgi:16S rRNA processing protein RimM
VALSTNRAERVALGTVFHTDQGELRIVAAQPHQHRHLVRFEGINHRDQAEALRGLVLRAEPLDDPDELWAHELIGAVVVDQHGVEHGPVTSLELNPASDLLVLEGGGLVPLTFVVEVEEGRIRVDVPEGLLE